jgi:hypothetical protein
MRIQSLAAASPQCYPRSRSFHRHVSSSLWRNRSLRLLLAVAIGVCIPVRTASFPFRSVAVQRRHAPLDFDSIFPVSSSKLASEVDSITRCARSRTPYITASTLFSNRNNNDNQDEKPFLVTLIDTLVDFSTRPLGSEANANSNSLAAIYPAALVLLAVTQPLSSFLTTLSIFVAFATATRQLVFVIDDDDDYDVDDNGIPYAETKNRGSERHDDDDDDDDRNMQVFLSDGFSLASAYASARLLLPTDMDAASWLPSFSASPGVAIGVLTATAGVAMFLSSTSSRGGVDNEADDDTEQRLLDRWDQQFKRRKHDRGKDNEQ